MNHLKSAAFRACYGLLPNEIQILADKNFQPLKLDPTHSSLQFKHVGGDVWSARVGIKYRALALKQASGYFWFWIGPHSHYDKIVGKSR